MARVEVAAFCFPNWHVDPRNEAWHGRGWTEWELVRSARPRFPGHRQPRRPAWGCFDESDPAWAAREIDLAADHGITCFLYDWYWYEDGAFLDGALSRGFLHAPNRARLSFALMWANHDWLDLFPVDAQNRPPVLARGGIGRAAFDRMVARVVGLMREPNHLRFAGRPFFSLYELGTFIAGMGGVAGAADAIASFRSAVRAAGLGELHLNCIVWGVQALPSEQPLSGEDRAAVLARLGVDSLTSYAWVHHHDPCSTGFPCGSWERARADNAAAWARYRAGFRLPYHPNVSVGWDSSPRTTQDDPFAARGYPWISTLAGTPAGFRAALADAKSFALAGDAPPLVTINAWNEWTEGSYLLPDDVDGTAYLEQVKAVFG